MSANKTKWVRLGEYIELCEERNSEGKYTIDDVRGISTDKKFIPTKANMDGVSVSSYKVVAPFMFAYVADTSRRGDKIALALNTSEESYLISSIYTVFKTSESILPQYLYMLLNRTEFDRYSRLRPLHKRAKPSSWIVKENMMKWLWGSILRKLRRKILRDLIISFVVLTKIKSSCLQ